MEKNVVYCTSEKELSLAEVLDYLKNVNVSKVMSSPAQKPCGGQIYVYKYGSQNIDRGMLF